MSDLRAQPVMESLNPRSALLAAAFLVALFSSTPGDLSTRAAQGPSSRPQPKNSAPKSPPKPKTPPELSVPFHIGEKLHYRVAWATFSSAATVELSALEKRELFGWQTWHFQASVHTINPVRNLFAIDDQFDSYSDSTSFESRQYESYLNELGKSEEEVVHLIPAGERLRAPGSAVVVLPGTRDVLGMLYALRAADWQKSPELRAPVYDGSNLYDSLATLENPSDPVKVDAGNFVAQRIAIRLFQNGKENSAIHFTLWLAPDAARTPILIAAQLPFGTLRVELTSGNLERADLR